MKPQVRVQRKRTKGWDMQKASPNGLPVVYVGRPSIYGNPFSVEKYGLEAALILYRDSLLRIWDGSQFPESVTWRADAYEEWLCYGIRWDTYMIEREHSIDSVIRRELRGKNLACFCPLDQRCHADVLLEIANG